MKREHLSRGGARGEERAGRGGRLPPGGGAGGRRRRRSGRRGRAPFLFRRGREQAGAGREAGKGWAGQGSGRGRCRDPLSALGPGSDACIPDVAGKGASGRGARGGAFPWPVARPLSGRCPAPGWRVHGRLRRGEGRPTLDGGGCCSSRGSGPHFQWPIRKRTGAGSARVLARVSGAHLRPLALGKPWPSRLLRARHLRPRGCTGPARPAAGPVGVALPDPRTRRFPCRAGGGRHRSAGLA